MRVTKEQVNDYINYKYRIHKLEKNYRDNKIGLMFVSMLWLAAVLNILHQTIPEKMALVVSVVGLMSIINVGILTLGYKVEKDRMRVRKRELSYDYNYEDLYLFKRLDLVDDVYIKFLLNAKSGQHYRVYSPENMEKTVELV